MNEVILHPANAVEAIDFTPDQIDLIKATVAKGATDNELRLFLYRCKNMGLDPLKPGQVHFIKYGSNPGSIVVGIDGFRAKAERSGKLKGIKRGVIRDGGKCIGAWCEVYRSDWDHPAREEVSLAEYNTGKAMWAKMPETMLKKVAEAAALRMAFPDDLGGIYSDDEMDQAAQHRPSAAKADRVNNLISEPQVELEPEIEEPDFITEAAAEEPQDLGEYIIPIGKKYKGRKLKELSPELLLSFVTWVETNIQNKNGETVEFLSVARAYLEKVERE